MRNLLVMRFWPRSSPQAGSGAEAEAACPDHGDCAYEDGEDDLKQGLTEKQMLKMLLKKVSVATASIEEMKSRDAAATDMLLSQYLSNPGPGSEINRASRANPGQTAVNGVYSAYM